MALTSGTLIAMGAMAALSAAKSAGDQQKADAARKRNAATTRYSAWTGLSPNEQVNEPNMIGDVAQGAVSGAALGQGMEKSGLENDLLKKQMATGGTQASMSQAASTPIPEMGSYTPQLNMPGARGPSLTQGMSSMGGGMSDYDEMMKQLNFTSASKRS